MSGRAYAVQNVPVTSPLTGLGWPVSRETAPPNVSRDTALSGMAGLGWPDEAPNVLPIGEAR